MLFNIQSILEILIKLKFEFEFLFVIIFERKIVVVLLVLLFVAKYLDFDNFAFDKIINFRF